MRSATAVKAGSGYPHRLRAAGVPSSVKCPQSVLQRRICCRSASVPSQEKILVSFITWKPAGGGAFNLDVTSTKTISADAGGKFSLPVKVATRLKVKFEAVADEKLAVSGGFAEAQVSRRLDVKLKKLGGGKLKFTVKGASPVTVYVLDSSGYEISGIKPKRTNRAGVAIFSPGNRHGEFSYYVDVGALADLYWEDPRHTFKL